MSDSPKCGAKNRSGGTCQNPPAAGRTRCRFHGGASLRGLQHPNRIHGRYSKHETRHQEAYTSARTDPDLLSLPDYIARMQVPIAELERLALAGSDPEEYARLLGAYKVVSDKVESFLKIQLSAHNAISVDDLTATLTALRSIIMEEAGPEKGERIWTRLERERLGIEAAHARVIDAQSE